jgi:hypothetical protein
MYLTYRHELMKQTPLAPDYAETSMPFHSGNGNGEGAAARRVHKILSFIFVYFDTWLKPLFSRVEKQNLSTIQEYDPYVGSLLRYLQNRRGD